MALLNAICSPIVPNSVKRVMEKELRVHYSGLIIFMAKILSVATGLVFTLLITRNATKEEYGVWANIFDLIGYFALLAAAIPFWVTRFAARGKKGAAKTGLFANSAIALVATAFYIPLLPFIISVVGIPESYMILYLVASIHIVELYLLNVLEAILRASNPRAIGYGLLVGEACKIILAYVLIVQFQQSLLGAMISLIAAISIQIVYYVKLVLPDLKMRVQWNYAKEWLRGSAANIYYMGGNQAVSFILLMLLGFGGEAARGEYQAAATIASIITYSYFVSFALYPRILERDSLGEVTMSLKMVLMFAIPMAAGAMALPDSLVTIVDEQYSEAATILVLLAIDAVVVTLSQFYTFVLLGVEKLDEETKIPFRHLIRSRIFKVFTLPYIHAGMTLPAAFYILTNFAFGQTLQAAFYVTLLNMAARLVMFFVLYTIVHRAVKLSVPWKSIAKYLLAATVMASVLYLLPHPTKLSLTLAATATGGAFYLVLLLAIDKESRELLARILQEIRGYLH